MMVRWNLFSTVTEAVTSSVTCSEIARMAALASAIAVLVPRRVIEVLLVASSEPFSMSIWAPVVSLISLMDAPPRPRMRATDRVGTVNLITLFDSFSNSAAYERRQLLELHSCEELRTSRSSDLAPATPFLPPLTRTSSGFSCSRVLDSPLSVF